LVLPLTGLWGFIEAALRASVVARDSVRP